MIALERDPAAAASRTHDLIVIGGGIHGICLTLEAARRGRRPLLVERDDFGGATSWNHQHIIHGGFRYLQEADLVRYRESLAEQCWFLRHFPELVERLECLMPLYGDGLRRPFVFRLGLALHALLSRQWSGAGRVLDAGRTRDLFPRVDPAGLRGAGLWHDVVMLRPERLTMELLRWACACGATAAGYTEALELIVSGGRVAGVRAHDRVSGESLELRAPVVVNCAGPWTGSLAARLDPAAPPPGPLSLSFNVLLDCEPLSDRAVAVAPRQPGARTYFLLPCEGRILAGTYQLPWSGAPEGIQPTAEQLEGFLADLNAAVPGLGASPTSLLRVHAGLVPAHAAGSAEAARRPVWIDHARAGGPHGLYSVAGIKFTTARKVAEQTLHRICGSLPDVRPGSDRPEPADAFRQGGGEAVDLSVDQLAALATSEAVVHLEDLVLRRLSHSAEREQALRCVPALARQLGWDAQRAEREEAECRTALRGAPL